MIELNDIHDRRDLSSNFFLIKRLIELSEKVVPLGLAGIQSNV
ncbi:hypothetical protein [Cytobacillus depressus]|nr:hypothetical protein [Cytobacillus depressus]